MGRDDDFAAFVEARRPHLYRVAYLLCGDHHRAEDLVQTALVGLYRSWSRVSRVGQLEAYARRAIVNAHLDETRRPWRRERSGLDGIDPPAAERPTGDHADLMTALRGLAPRQRRIVVLRYYVGLSVDETAADLGVSPGTVKAASSHGLANLRRSLPHHEMGI